MQSKIIEDFLLIFSCKSQVPKIRRGEQSLIKLASALIKEPFRVR